MKRQRSVLPPLKAMAAALATCFTVNAQALPTAPVVTNGSASFQQTGNSLTVTNSNGAIIRWNSFSVGAGETTHFIQPSASSSVLNRVVGTDPSSIYGTLSSNGRIYLVNPAGIYVGPGGRVDAAAFIASTLALSDSDFLAGRLIFNKEGEAGAVENHGIITTPEGGSVYLVGSRVENTGAIDTPNGEAILAAGQSVQLINTGTPGVSVEFSASDESVQNFGTIAATGGQIGLAGALVKNSGTVNASSVSREGGRVFLRASRQVEVDAAGRIVANGTRGGSVQLQSGDLTLLSGSIEARGNADAGGRVEVLGDKVGLFDGASVDASGQTGGGTILVGGDLQGDNAAVQNASVTWLGRDARLTSDAVASGDGGKIIVWADDTTRVYGQISARGGSASGDGGFVEVSGKRSLVFESSVDLGSDHGEGGTLLLDPMDVNIIFGAIDNPATFYGDASWHETANASASTNLYWLDGTGPGLTGIQDLLNAGTNVVISTAGSYGGPVNGGSINMTYGGGSPYTWTSSATLKLLAHNNITINDGVVATLGTLDMVASWDGNFSSPNVAAGGGAITEGADGYLRVSVVKAAAGGNVTLNHSQNQVADLKAYSDTGSITYNGGASSGSNDIFLRDLQAPNGSITVNNNAGVFGGNVTLGYLEASTAIGGSVTVTARKAILEDDVGSADIIAYGATLTSAYGASSPATLAISVDFDVGGSIGATVNGTANYGGIRLLNAGSSSFDFAGSVSTSDGSVFGGNTSYFGQGEVDITARHVFTNTSGLGSLQVSTPDDLYISGTVGGFENITLTAGLDLETGVIGTVNASKVASLSAGNLVWIDGTGTINGAEGVGILASSVLIQGTVNSATGAISIAADQVTIDGVSTPGLVAGNAGVSIIGASGIVINDGTVSTGANLSFNGDIVLLTSGEVLLENNALITNAKSSPAPLADVAVLAGGDIKLNNGSRIVASDDVFLELTGGSSSLILNESNLMSPSYILSDVSSGLIGTTYIDFLGRADGGVIIDGVLTTVTTGSSGFFNLSASQPALLGSGLQITYAGGVDPVSKEIGSIFDTNTRDTESINDIENEDVDKLAEEIAAEQASGEGQDGNGTNEEGNQDGSGKSKPAQCT